MRWRRNGQQAGPVLRRLQPLIDRLVADVIQLVRNASLADLGRVTAGGSPGREKPRPLNLLQEIVDPDMVLGLVATNQHAADEVGGPGAPSPVTLREGEAIARVSRAGIVLRRRRGIVAATGEAANGERPLADSEQLPGCDVASVPKRD